MIHKISKYEQTRQKRQMHLIGIKLLNSNIKSKNINFGLSSTSKYSLKKTNLDKILITCKMIKLPISQQLSWMLNMQGNPQIYDIEYQTPYLNAGMDKVSLDIVCLQYSSNTKVQKTSISINILDDYEPHSLEHHQNDQEHQREPAHRRNPFEFLVHEEENSLDFKHQQELIGTHDNCPKMEPQIQYQNVYMNVNLEAASTSGKEKEYRKPNKMQTKLQYKQETRQQKVKRYLQKKQKRVWEKKISYVCRKKVADRRDRANGRFVKKADKIQKSRNQNNFNNIKLQSTLSKFSDNISMKSYENICENLYAPFDLLNIKSQNARKKNKTFQITKSK